ncbi:agmatinase [Candidatus Bathyarchaeota archaeon ex4484_135]|nr:MAG: agmatinase [Candidatus Bathyarchaeota archaeon ex4484_135]
MSLRELFTSPAGRFLSSERTLDEAEWAFLGVPLDVSSTFRPGSRSAPLAVRKASLGLEIRSLITGSRLNALRICDIGDLHITLDVEETLRKLEAVVEELVRASKKVAVVGGEHTITLGIVPGLKKALRMPKVIIFDAHLDMRDEFQGVRICHATVGRRLTELVGPDRMAFLGVRACSDEGLDFARENGIMVITSRELRAKGAREVIRSLEPILDLEGPLHISLDMDVLDPSFAPAVQTPEPFGLEPGELLELLTALCRRGLTSFDLVEMAPDYDNGQTAILAARLLAEVMWAGSGHA